MIYNYTKYLNSDQLFTINKSLWQYINPNWNNYRQLHSLTSTTTYETRGRLFNNLLLIVTNTI